ncbi:MAG: type III-B CRISPR module RAMP protein Cmr1 [Wolinella succinogenes]|uniref:type III-B CRISPR module RAMP protein Cmr1 n=1 Tax=Wolinella succinogenes TaxID=844 RepID=UPI0016998DBE|nr:type III-B CRISPR module RAMP protein Cmr1 [Wolinella succinogenes]
MNKEIKATFRIVTPMFLGDWEQGVGDGIRPPSVKGALRFWWRALNWKTAIKQSNNDENKALKWLHKEEARLFGAAAGENGGGQGVFLLKVTQQEMLKETPKLQPGQQYLAGQGLWHFRNGLLRQCIARDQKFDIEIRFSNKTNDADKKNIGNAILIFGLLGGLGSRARKGFGSLSLESIEGVGDFAIPSNEQEYKSAIKNLVTSDIEELPPFTAFSKKTRIDISQKGRDAFTVLNEIGRQMQMYRSYGHNRNGVHIVDSKPAEQNFKNDHDAMLNFSRNNTLLFVPRRTVFGMPHNYFFSSTKANIEFFPKLKPSDDSGRRASPLDESGRRASPLFIHIHKFSNGESIGVQALIPSTFLPDSAEVYAKMDKATASQEVSVDWQVIGDYLDRFKSRTEVIR